MQRGGGGLKKIEGSKQFLNVPMDFGPEGRVIQNVWLQGSFSAPDGKVTTDIFDTFVVTVAACACKCFCRLYNSK